MPLTHPEFAQIDHFELAHATEHRSSSLLLLGFIVTGYCAVGSSVIRQHRMELDSRSTVENLCTSALSFSASPLCLTKQSSPIDNIKWGQTLRFKFCPLVSERKECVPICLFLIRIDNLHVYLRRWTKPTLSSCSDPACLKLDSFTHFQEFLFLTCAWTRHAY